jgi:hypothetical protein
MKKWCVSAGDLGMPSGSVSLPPNKNQIVASLVLNLCFKTLKKLISKF